MRSVWQKREKIFLLCKRTLPTKLLTICYRSLSLWQQIPSVLKAYVCKLLAHSKHAVTNFERTLRVRTITKLHISE
jgi:hypothetical protein